MLITLEFRSTQRINHRGPSACILGLKVNRLYGYAGKIMKVDLTKRKTTTELLEKNLASLYIGGKGFGSKTISGKMRPGLNPYDPSNLLIFAAGPVTGAQFSGTAKFCAVFKSPLTGIWG